MAEQPRKRARVDEEDGGAGGSAGGAPREAPEGSDAEAVVAAIQDQLAVLKQSADDEIIAIEIAYNKRRRPLYEKRGAALATIPGFWCTVLQKHNEFRQYMGQGDLQVLQHLLELSVEENADIESGFKVTLRFEDNPFIANREITRCGRDRAWRGARRGARRGAARAGGGAARRWRRRRAAPGALAAQLNPNDPPHAQGILENWMRLLFKGIYEG